MSDVAYHFPKPSRVSGQKCMRVYFDTPLPERKVHARRPLQQQTPQIPDIVGFLMAQRERNPWKYSVPIALLRARPHCRYERPAEEVRRRLILCAFPRIPMARSLLEYSRSHKTQ